MCPVTATPGNTDADADPAAGLRARVDEIGGGPSRRVDPGTRAMGLAIGVFVLVVAALLPWVGGVPGWHLLLGVPEPVKIDVLPRVFAMGVFAFGLLGTALVLVTRRWWLAWLCTLASGVFTVLGVVSVWSQQSSPSHQSGPGPGIGLVLALLTMLVLTVLWARIVWSRPGGVFNRPS
jgi:hypothetical protein